MNRFYYFFYKLRKKYRFLHVAVHAIVRQLHKAPVTLGRIFFSDCP